MALINITWTPGRKKRARIAAVFFLTLLAFLILNRIPFISSVTQRVQSVVFSIGNGIGGAISRVTTSKEEITDEKNYYQALAATLAVDQARLAELENNNAEMEMQLAYKESAPWHLVAARIIARSEAGENTFLIDKGTQDGLRNGLAVVVEDGHLIGSVTDARARSATVTLIKDQNSEVPGMILGTEGTVGIIEGQGGFLLHMDFIPQRVPISPSDVVVTSGLDGIFPQGLILGVVDSVIKVETAPFQEAFVRPIFDANGFTNVFVIDPFEPAI